MPSVSQSQRGLIFSKREKYGSVENAPKKWKWVFEEGWENKGKLPKKKKKKKTNEEKVISFTDSLVLETVTYLNIKTEKEYGKPVKQCYHGCPFFGGGKEMECDHPYWEGKGAYDNMIITQDNSHGRVPDECPLREGGIKISKYIYLEK